MNRLPVFMTVFVLALGSFLYFNYADQMIDQRLYENLRMKTNYLDGNLKIFAQARNNDLSMMRSTGNSIPEKGSMVLGHEEADMMIREKLISGPGDSLKDFFGIDIKVEGILKKTGAIVDDMHFLSPEDFSEIQGEEGKIKIIVEDGMPKVFYHYDLKEPLKLSFSEGSLQNYKILQKDGKKYYPVIIGSEEAKMMKEKRLFNEVGDTIEGFFGTDAIIAGILEKTGSSVDMMHLVMKGGGI